MEKAIQLRLIERTTENAKWLDSNVRKATVKDPHFINPKRGVFDLASRQENIAKAIN